MKKKLVAILEKWPKFYISSQDLKIILNSTSLDAFYSLIKRSIKEGILIKLKRDLFLISQKIKDKKIDSFEISSIIYGPSYISFESALSYHGWIPEAVSAITCSSSKKSVNFQTAIGAFLYYHIPVKIFHIGISFVLSGNSKIFMADPWKAIADLIYLKKKKWKNVFSLSDDMRIEIDLIQHSDIKLLSYLAENYPNNRTKSVLKNLYKDLKK
jgi:predicted transcriptional regulator of viral defense system